MNDNALKPENARGRPLPRARQPDQPPAVPTSPSVKRGPGSKRGLRLHLLAALMIAGLSDALSLGVAFAPPAQWAVDCATAVLLFAVLGWQWALLPAMIMEAIPGLAVFPFWVLVVSSIVLWGVIKRTPKETSPRPQLDRGPSGRQDQQPSRGQGEPRIMD